MGSIVRTELDTKENNALVAQAVIETITPLLLRVCTGLCGIGGVVCRFSVL